MGEGMYILSGLDSREAIDFIQSFKMEKINSHKLPESIESASKRICIFKIAAQRAEQAA